MIYIYIDIYIHYIDTGTDNIASFMQVSYGRTTFEVVRTTSHPPTEPTIPSQRTYERDADNLITFAQKLCGSHGCRLLQGT